MIHPVREIAAEVIRQTGKDKPADAALREVLKSLRDLAPFDARKSPRRFSLINTGMICLTKRAGKIIHCL